MRIYGLSACTQVWFGSGHQIILGLLPALVDVLGSHAKFIRLRRNRFDTAYSFTQNHGDPCTDECKFCLCPLDSATRCPPHGHVWHKLNSFERYLWAVDEVECQWQALLNSRPSLKFIEVSYSCRAHCNDSKSIIRSMCKMYACTRSFDVRTRE